MNSVNITDEEKEKLKCGHNDSEHNADEVSTRPFLDTVLSALDCSENDYLALLSSCLIYALANNKGMIATFTQFFKYFSMLSVFVVIVVVIGLYSNDV